MGNAARGSLCSFVSAVTLAKAAELETTHIFGFTFGSDVNAVGEKEAESEAWGVTTTPERIAPDLRQ